MSYFPKIYSCLSLCWACSVQVVIATSFAFIFISLHLLILLSVVHILFIRLYLSILYLMYGLVFCLECVFFCNFVIFPTSYYPVQVRVCLVFAFISSLHMPDILRSPIVLSSRWSKPHFLACEVVFVKKGMFLLSGLYC